MFWERNDALHLFIICWPCSSHVMFLRKEWCTKFVHNMLEFEFHMSCIQCIRLHPSSRPACCDCKSQHINQLPNVKWRGKKSFVSCAREKFSWWKRFNVHVFPQLLCTLSSVYLHNSRDGKHKDKLIFCTWNITDYLHLEYTWYWRTPHVCALCIFMYVYVHTSIHIYTYKCTSCGVMH